MSDTLFCIGAQIRYENGSFSVQRLSLPLFAEMVSVSMQRNKAKISAKALEEQCLFEVYMFIFLPSRSKRFELKAMFNEEYGQRTRGATEKDAMTKVTPVTAK